MELNSAQWELAKRGFCEALEREGRGRADFLESLSEPGIRAAVESLLAAHGEAGEFLDRAPGVALDAEDLAGLDSEDEDVAQPAGGEPEQAEGDTTPRRGRRLAFIAAVAVGALALGALAVWLLRGE